MAILKIARMGHRVLREPAAAIADPTTPEIARLVADMVDTLADAGGVGLAAPQVHVGLRLVIFQVPLASAAPDRYRDAGLGDEGCGVPLTVLVNPLIEPLGDEMDEAWEGCLSLPGFVGLVPRHRRIRYSGLDLAGAPVVREAHGFHARVVQHECDHLDGRLYPARIRDLRNFGYAEEIRAAMAARSGDEEAEV